MSSEYTIQQQTKRWEIMSVRQKYDVAMQDPNLKFVDCIDVGACIVKNSFDWSTHLEVTWRLL